MQGYSELVWFNDYFILDNALSCACAGEAYMLDLARLMG